MNRRFFGRTLLGMAAAAPSAFSQARNWSQFKPRPGSLREKMHKGEPIRTASAPVDSTRSQLEAIIKERGKVDLFGLDAQHGPLPDEAVLIRFCNLAEELGAGVRIRIPHFGWANMTGRFADLGILSILVPQVDDVETAEKAIDNFYYPPLGHRSWGGANRFGDNPPPGTVPAAERRKYADWWNGTGILGFQVESVKAALNIRSIVQPGVDFISWGANDMGFDIERPNSPFKTVDEVHAFVIEQLKGFDVRVPGRR